MKNHPPSSSRRIFASLAVVLATGLFWLGCTDDAAQLPTAPEAQLQTQVAVLAQELGPAIAAQKKHGERLMAIDGVLGHGAGLTEAGEPTVVVYLVEPGVRGIPNRLEDVPVTTQVTGLFWTRQDRTARARPAPNGFSVGHPDITAGTLGARVRDGGNVYILSNNHVTAASNSANIGDPTLQPGSFDGGSEPDDVIGTLAAYKEILFDGSDNVMDAAISLVDEADVTGATPSTAGYGAPGTSVTSASVGLGVQKYGRTTGHTTGTVEEINVTVTVCYAGFIFCTQSARFVNQISISDGTFSDGGDSGSLIVTNDSDANPVGLLFAGSSTRTLANPIGPVLQEFGVSIYPPGDDDPGDPEPEGPTASFTFECTALECDFDGSGSTPGDSPIASYDWTFGDGASGSGVTVSHTYGADGTYTVTLTVTDGNDLDDSTSQNVTVAADDPGDPDPGDFTLSATGFKVRGVKHADLSWSGATSTNVDVYRDGSLVATVANTGSHTDNTGARGNAPVTYHVCEEGSNTCSNEATANF